MESESHDRPQPAASGRLAERNQGSDAGRIIVGLGLIALGGLLLVQRNGWMDVDLSGRYLWPFIVLAFGVARFADPGYHAGRRRSRRSGAWLLAIGLWGIVNEFHIAGFDYRTSWPLLIVATGLAVVWRSVEEPERGAGRRIREQ